MISDFRDYHRAVEDVLTHKVWARLGEKGLLRDEVERLRESRVELSDSGKLPALVFVQAVARVTDADSLKAYLVEHDRLSISDDGEPSQGALVYDAVLLPLEYVADDDAVVWAGGISRHGETDEGELVVEAPLQIDAVELRRGRAIQDLDRLLAATIAEFASETPGIEIVHVEVERIG